MKTFVASDGDIKCLGKIFSIIVHDYFRVDYDIVWDVVQGELPILKAQLQRILETLE